MKNGQGMVDCIMRALVRPLKGRYTDSMEEVYRQKIWRAVEALKPGISIELRVSGVPSGIGNNPDWCPESRVRVSMDHNSFRLERIHPPESPLV